MRVTKRIPDREGERGATAVIVTLSLIALLGLTVLTVDVGQLLFKRRSMVNASDAAALAAAQSCAGLGDSDVPEALADTFALDNATAINSGAGNIVQMTGCDGPTFGNLTVRYESEQGLFFAGVLGANGPAAVNTEATAGWGPTGSANPMPIVVYTGQSQGNCDIQEGIGIGVQCYLWYDNDLFNQSSFGFLNLCTANDPCTQGWDVSAGAQCPNVGASLRSDWINGNWTGGPNETNYPAPTFVCRVSGLTSSNWSDLEARAGPAGHTPNVIDEHDLIFPVNDCNTQVDTNGNAIGCNATVAPDKYNIIGFIVLHLEQVLDQKSEWQGNSGSCDFGPVNMTPTIPDFDLDTLQVSEGCPSYDTIAPPRLTAPGNNPFQCNPCTEGTHYTYDPNTHVIDWIGNNRNNVTITWDWSQGGPCGVAPNNSSAVCIKTSTVEVRFGGSGVCEECPDFGLRSVRLCDLQIGSCPEDNS